MNQNVGPIDQAIRLIIGLVIIILGLSLGSLWGLVGLVLVVTGAVGRCPLYRLVGLNTRHRAVT